MTLPHPLSGNSDKTAETVDLTQPVEGNDCLPLCDNSNETVDWSHLPQETSRDPPVLDPHVCEFLSGTGSPGSGGDEPDQSSMPKPSFHDPQEWVRWCTCWVETPTWWLELAAVPKKGDVWVFARRIQASFHMPKECYCTTNAENKYTVPPTPHCMRCNDYLPPPDIRFSTKDFHLKQPKKNFGICKGPATLSWSG